MLEEGWSQTAFLGEFAINAEDLETVLDYIGQAIERAGLEGNANTTTNRTKINNIIDDAWNANELLFRGCAASADLVKKGLRPYVRYFRAENNKKAKGKSGTSSGAKRPLKQQTPDPEARIKKRPTTVEQLGLFRDPPEISEASVLHQQVQPLKDQYQAALHIAQPASVRATEEHLAIASAPEKIQAPPSTQKMTSRDNQKTTETAESVSMKHRQHSISRHKKYTRSEKETEDETQDAEGAGSATVSLSSKSTIPPTHSDGTGTSKATERIVRPASISAFRSISPAKFGTYRPPNVLLTRRLPIPLDLQEQRPPATRDFHPSSTLSTNASKKLTRAAPHLQPPDAHLAPHPQVLQPTALASGQQLRVLDRDPNEAMAKITLYRI